MSLFYRGFSHIVRPISKFSRLESLIRFTSTQAAVCHDIEKELQGIRDAGTYKDERVIVGKQGVSINVQGREGKLLNFCANNYLGLSSHPEVVKAGKEALDSRGAGLSSVRFICGTQDIHKDLEKKIARFHQREEAILYAACYDANAGLFEVLLAARRRLIVSDGVFSMDGNVAPLREVCDLADRYNAMVFIDECHATGFFGKTGRGTEDHLGIMGRVDLINSTLGKALGGAMGGYTTGPKTIIDLLRQRSRPYLFSNSLAPAVVGSASKVMDMLLESPHYAESLLAKTTEFRGRMTQAGFTLSGSPQHPICPVMLGDARLAGVFAEKMLDKGIYVIGFSFPVVPRGQARIRVQISAAHSHEDIDVCVEAFKEIGKELGVI